jgi:iron-sulfur cluster repair protein YtfE (RIC family)
MKLTRRRVVTAVLGASAAGLPFARAQRTPAEETVAAMTIVIPESIRREHEAIHSALVAATRMPGRVGVVARTLADVLHPHFVREEEIALPPLGLLAPLAAGAPLQDSALAAAAAMASTLRAEMPRMLEEHGRIRAAVAELRAAADAEGAVAQRELAEELALHAQTEEEVLYPAAMLVGDLIRARQLQR